MPANVWIQAAAMTDIVWSKWLQRGEISLGGRVLDPAHFEFRQGQGEQVPATPLRRRATHRLRLQGD